MCESLFFRQVLCGQCGDIEVAELQLEDIERAAAEGVAARTPQTEAPTVDRATGLRQTIAAAMARSKREIPHYCLAATIDLHRALTWLAEQNDRRPVADRLLYGVRTRPWVVDGQVVGRPLIHATLSADHRVTDGHRGALFLSELDRLLQKLEKL